MKRLKLLPILIMLIAGLITCVIAIVKNFDNAYALTILFIVLLSFYIIGLIARAIIKKVCFIDEVALSEEDEESAEDEMTDEGSTKGDNI
ncbi:MAG: hypothetical protein ACERKZ_01395 [Lachnotalea sp.]